MIEVINLKKRYKNIKALKGISFEIKEGEIFLILGPNGAGKTTLIKIILGILFPDEGKVLFRKKPVFGYMQEEKIGKPDWKVERYLRFIGDLGGIDKRMLNKRILGILERLKLKEKRESRIKELSHGLKQRLKWAQAILLEPEILVLDEPTSGLDPIGKVEMRKWIKEEKEKGKTIIISSHLLDEMEKIGDRFIILVNGKKKDEGLIEKLKEKDLEAHFYNVVKGESNEGNI
ncbi:ABC transporter ATP-binding protein [Candidatus Aminicenantes bacterium AC-335-A11]|jgi:ABC-2 type transport system ATP-binding protein|nr:ABC transporter ATP-binding protein [SCandidatus Aminicenantes bacterium Aminicenantia_JdfR_composite]MCP2597465.1 ABC transporter ATP-binding protein [Candidatus Aminicenantes bacterium AC-335-G13]MCP2598710.1 ABC transporter ATP-binding protein [Candidatus Aminicenantes bacterium AC-335-L06]MCP2618975.1 ABC transporter ATP-binding protein [Candidatus Aminicenantes bacterium AC-335-A11]